MNTASHFATPINEPITKLTSIAQHKNLSLTSNSLAPVTSPTEKPNLISEEIRGAAEALCTLHSRNKSETELLEKSEVVDHQPENLFQDKFSSTKLEQELFLEPNKFYHETEQHRQVFKEEKLASWSKEKARRGKHVGGKRKRDHGIFEEKNDTSGSETSHPECIGENKPIIADDVQKGRECLKTPTRNMLKASLFKKPSSEIPETFLKSNTSNFENTEFENSDFETTYYDYPDPTPEFYDFHEECTLQARNSVEILW